MFLKARLLVVNLVQIIRLAIHSIWYLPCATKIPSRSCLHFDKNYIFRIFFRHSNKTVASARGCAKRPDARLPKQAIFSIVDAGQRSRWPLQPAEAKRVLLECLISVVWNNLSFADDAQRGTFWCGTKSTANRPARATNVTSSILLRFCNNKECCDLADCQPEVRRLAVRNHRISATAAATC